MKKNICKILAFLAAAVMVLSQTGCAAAAAVADGDGAGGFFSGVWVDLFGEEEQDFKQIVLNLPRHQSYSPIEDKYAYYCLTTETQRQAYESIERAMFQVTDVWSEKNHGYAMTRAFIPELSSVDIFVVKEAVFNDHPEAFWLLSEYSIGSNLHDGSYVVLYSAFSYNEIVNMNAMLERSISRIFSQIPSNAGEYRRELLLHDILVQNIEYDVEAAEDTDGYCSAANVYGALVEHSALCSGYAQTFRLLCCRLGISCITVKGVSQDEGHMWNIAQIGGNWYHVDVTWDDPIMSGSEELEHYDYFNLTDERIFTDHTVAEGYDKLEEVLAHEIADDYRAFFNFPLPQCVSEKYNYYKLNALHITALNEESAELISEQMKEMCRSGENYLYLSFPESMTEEKATEWVTVVVGGEIENVNAYAMESELNLIDRCVRVVHDSTAPSPWTNICCIKVIYCVPTENTAEEQPK